MELHFYNYRFNTLIEQYTLSEDQLRYTSTPKDCIELLIKDPDRYSILAINGGQLVTFFVLHKNEGVKPYSNNKEVAQGLYKKCGFIDEGERKMGKKGELIIMSYHLKLLIV